jgi:hypothetical protein
MPLAPAHHKTSSQLEVIAGNRILVQTFRQLRIIGVRSTAATKWTSQTIPVRTPQ